MKEFSGKALYQPKGKAKEYSEWAVNFFTGCSNDCDYCYCKRGMLSHVWDNKPHLKKCFINENDALDTFVRELERNLEEIGDSGILFSFTTDPLLPETRELTFRAMEEAISLEIPVKILTKRADWLKEFIRRTEIQTINYKDHSHLIAFGFTLTGYDEQEPGASSNQERINAMRSLHDKGFKTFASIEPVISPAKSTEMIYKTLGFCNLYKVGLISGKGKGFYDDLDLSVFWSWLVDITRRGCKVYPKKSLIEYMHDDRFNPEEGCFVNSDYNIFTNN